MILSKMVGFVGTSASFHLEARNDLGGITSSDSRWSRNVGAFLYAFKWFSWVKTYVIYIYIHIWVNYNDLTVLPHWKSWLVMEIIPKRP